MAGMRWHAKSSVLGHVVCVGVEGRLCAGACRRSCSALSVCLFSLCVFEAGRVCSWVPSDFLLGRQTLLLYACVCGSHKRQAMEQLVLPYEGLEGLVEQGNERCCVKTCDVCSSPFQLHVHGCQLL